MKYLKTFEGKNTMNWYVKVLSKSNDIEKFEKMIISIIENSDVEEFKMIESEKDCVFFIYTGKSNQQRNFKNWNISSAENIRRIKTIGTEIEDIYEWLEELKFRKEAENYNL